MSEVWSYLREHFFVGHGIESKIFYSIAALLVFGTLKWILLFVFLRNREVKSQYRLWKTITYIIWPIAFIVIGRIWFTGFQALSTYLGLLSAGLAIALQSPLVNLAGWAFIL